MLINCIAWFILILSSHKFCVWKENSYKCIFNKVRHKNNYVQAFLVLILHCVSLVNLTTILTPNVGLRWPKIKNIYILRTILLFLSVYDSRCDPWLWSVEHKRRQVVQIWNNMRLSKLCNIISGLTIPLSHIKPGSFSFSALKFN